MNFVLMIPVFNNVNWVFKNLSVFNWGKSYIIEIVINEFLNWENEM
jgi:hypothetical protein